MAVTVGQPAPDFTLYDADKQKRSLTQFRGKNVVLAFFPGAFTGVCDKEMCALRDSMDRLNGLNAQVVGVSVDSFAALKAFANQYRLTFPLLTDFNREAITKYDVLWKGLGGVEGYNVANRAVFLLDRSGVVRWKWVAERPGVEPPYDQIIAELGKLPR